MWTDGFRSGNPTVMFNLSMLKDKVYSNNPGTGDYFKESIQNDNML